MTRLRQCPCGQIPPSLEINDCGQGSKWAMATPGCCGEWSIEFRTQYFDFESPECMALAVDAWNEAPRAASHKAALRQAADYLAKRMAPYTKTAIEKAVVAGWLDEVRNLPPQEPGEAQEG